MAGDSTGPLSVDEAKQRLRDATREIGLQGWMHHNPWGFMALALGGGYLAGRLPTVRRSMLWVLARTMLTLAHK